MRRRFFWAIFGVSTALIVLLIGFAVATANAVRDGATRAELERAGQAIAAVLSERLDGPQVLEAVRSGRLGNVVGDLGPLRAVAGGSAIDVFALGPDGVIGRSIPDVDVDFDALRAGEPQIVEARTGGGPPRFVYAAPVATFPARQVVLVATVSREAPVTIDQPGGLILVVVAVAAVIAALLARVLSHRLTGQLRSVADAAEQVSTGDFAARADVGGTAEIDVVAEAFNDMAAAMEASRDRERQFLLSVGHDLRTPLTTITGYAEALEEGVDDASERHRIAGVMSAEGRRLGRLIEDVMLLARLDASDFGLRPEPVEVELHLDDVLAPFRDRAAQVRVAWDQHLDAPGERTIDPDRLGQIVGNLVENALRHTPETGRVGFGAAVDGEALVIRVEDSGPGIDAEDLPRVFDRFYVARGHRGVRPEGSGLGLSIVRRLVEAMGGTVTATSPATGGTTIEVRLPAPPA